MKNTAASLEEAAFFVKSKVKKQNYIRVRPHSSASICVQIHKKSTFVSSLLSELELIINIKIKIELVIATKAKMTKYILYVATSIDGYIARSDGSIDWLLPPEQVNKNKDYLKFYNSIDAIVMGSTTYEQILGFGDWAYPGKLSYVLTSRNLSTLRLDIVFMKSMEEIVEDVNKRGYQRVWLMGGGRAASPFIQNGLVDEYFIFIIPIILGTGITLYQSLSELKLDLISQKSCPYGVVELHYKRK